MKKIMLIGWLLLIICSCVYAEEEITLSTYYPSPHGAYQFLELILYGDTFNESISPELSFKRANTTESPMLYGSPTIGNINFEGHTGAGFKTGARICAKASAWVRAGENTSDGRIGIHFQTDDGANGLKDRMAIWGDGSILIGVDQTYGKLTIGDDIDSNVTVSIVNPNTGKSSRESICLEDNNGTSRIEVYDSTHSTNPSEEVFDNHRLNGKMRFTPSSNDNVQDVVINSDGSMQFMNMPAIRGGTVSLSVNVNNSWLSTAIGFSVYAPSSGFLLVQVTGQMYHLFVADTRRELRVGISDVKDALLQAYVTSALIFQRDNDTYIPFSVSHIYQIDEAGLKTFYVSGWKNGGGKLGVSGTIQALYFPAGLSDVVPEPPPSDDVIGEV